MNAHLKPLDFMFEGDPQRPYTRTISVLDDLLDDPEIRGSAVVLASPLAMAPRNPYPYHRRSGSYYDNLIAASGLELGADLTSTTDRKFSRLGIMLVF